MLQNCWFVTFMSSESPRKHYQAFTVDSCWFFSRLKHLLDVEEIKSAFGVQGVQSRLWLFIKLLSFWCWLLSKKSPTCVRSSGQVIVFLLRAFLRPIWKRSVDQWAGPVSLAEAALTGQDELWSWGPNRSLHVSVWETSAHLQEVDITLALLLFSCFLKHRRMCNFSWRDGSVYHNNGRWTSKRKWECSGPFSICLYAPPSYLFISPSHSDWLDRSEG